MSKVVIIGGVAGGASAAARLRRLDEQAEIVLLERGAYISYANCGLPYHVGDVISSRDALLLLTPETMKARYNIDVRVQNEVTAINRDAKSVSITNHATGESYDESYDTLIIATGSSPLRPPIPGIDSPRIRTLWTVPDTDEIRAIVRGEAGQSKAQTAIVVGGGFIGLEMAENLHEAGLKVSLVEALDQVMAPLDFEMAQLLHENILDKGVALHLGDGVDSFADDGKQVTVKLASGKELTADLVILSIGVRPNSQLAKDAGLECNQRGGIVVDEQFHTADENIYAIGDVIEVNDLVFGDRTMVPLAGPANKQGRMVADIICGANRSYRGTQGTAVAKVFDLSAASTGANEKTLQRRGLERGRDYDYALVRNNHHAGYYPGAEPLTLKVIYSLEDERILGAQAVGTEGVDKRVDTVAVVLRMGGTIADLTELELAYAPPFSSAKDPVNMAGFVAENQQAGLMKVAAWDAFETVENVQVVDVRQPDEVLALELPGAVNIPLGEIRERLGELDPSRPTITSCAIGVRAYNAARILQQNGFADVSVYPAGARFWHSTHLDIAARNEEVNAAPFVSAAQPQISTSSCASTREIEVNCCGMQCPGPIMAVSDNLKQMEPGEVLRISASDPGFARDIDAWCRRTGNSLISNEKDGKTYVACVRKGDSKEPSAVRADHSVHERDGKTIVVFSGDMDKVMASFIIANGAAAMGRPVTMFFTFWGLTALRKPTKVSVAKSAIEKMFGVMLPRGAEKLGLSRMNMAGMGARMMKKIMADKNVTSLPDLMQCAMNNGVKIIACTMSMDVMGIRPEELIDGIEFAGVGTYLGDAEESDVNLFI
ncbi:MAG: FAD-dependent oxidoreductase [Atopobiaceae bacterium]|nr:FAD-dependent oxidoreductase [Atopobiaceae bacterium]